MIQNKRKRADNSLYSLGRRVPLGVTNDLKNAQDFYLKRQFPEAIQLFASVIKSCPNIPAPYYTLGLIYEESGDFSSSLKFYMLAAAFSPKKTHLWGKVLNSACCCQGFREGLVAVNNIIKAEDNIYLQILKVTLLAKNLEGGKALNLIKSLHATILNEQEIFSNYQLTELSPDDKINAYLYVIERLHCLGVASVYCGFNHKAICILVRVVISLIKYVDPVCVAGVSFESNLLNKGDLSNILAETSDLCDESVIELQMNRLAKFPHVLFFHSSLCVLDLLLSEVIDAENMLKDAESLISVIVALYSTHFSSLGDMECPSLPFELILLHAIIMMRTKNSNGLKFVYAHVLQQLSNSFQLFGGELDSSDVMSATNTESALKQREPAVLPKSMPVVNSNSSLLFDSEEGNVEFPDELEEEYDDYDMEPIDEQPVNLNEWCAGRFHVYAALFCKYSGYKDNCSESPIIYVGSSSNADEDLTNQVEKLHTQSAACFIVRLWIRLAEEFHTLGMVTQSHKIVQSCIDLSKIDSSNESSSACVLSETVKSVLWTLFSVVYGLEHAPSKAIGVCLKAVQCDGENLSALLKFAILSHVHRKDLLSISDNMVSMVLLRVVLSLFTIQVFHDTVDTRTEFRTDDVLPYCSGMFSSSVVRTLGARGGLDAVYFPELLSTIISEGCAPFSEYSRIIMLNPRACADIIMLSMEYVDAIIATNPVLDMNLTLLCCSILIPVLDSWLCADDYDTLLSVVSSSTMKRPPTSLRCGSILELLGDKGRTYINIQSVLEPLVNYYTSNLLTFSEQANSTVMKELFVLYPMLCCLSDFICVSALFGEEWLQSKLQFVYRSINSLCCDDEWSVQLKDGLCDRLEVLQDAMAVSDCTSDYMWQTGAFSSHFEHKRDDYERKDVLPTERKRNIGNPVNSKRSILNSLKGIVDIDVDEYCADSISKRSLNHLCRSLVLYTNSRLDKVISLCRGMEQLLPHSILFKEVDTYSAHMLLTTFDAAYHKNRATEAFNGYLSVIKASPNEPIPWLCLCAYQLILSRRVPGVMTGAEGVCLNAWGCFLKYTELRSNPYKGLVAGAVEYTCQILIQQEVSFNMGRIYEELGLFGYAEKCYHAVLELVDKSVGKRDEGLFRKHSLTREAAFNLMLLYKKSGNIELVRSIVDRYLDL